MGKRLNRDEMQQFFESLQESYDIYGPKLYQGTGCFSDTDVVRYGQLESWEELVWDRKSDYSFKEALFPISETILYFTENEMKTADGPARPRMIFLKSCDFHALKRLDEMYLRNGAEDFYYRRMRENTVFAVMGCKESGESCFCVSMGTNRCEGYDIYAFQDENGCYVDVKSGELESLLPECGQSTEEEPVFVEKNPRAMECIKENLKYTKLDKKAMTMTKDVMTALYQLEGEKTFDYIFMDPPYDQELEKKVLSYLSESNLVYEDTVIIVEASLDTDFSYLEQMGFRMIKTKEYKTNKHVFIEKEGKQEIC